MCYSRRTGFFNVVNPRDTYAEKILREASVNRRENRGRGMNKSRSWH